VATEHGKVVISQGQIVQFTRNREIC